MFEELPKSHYRVILADPPWSSREVGWSGGGEFTGTVPELHYPTMSERELIELPVGELAAKDALLFLWVMSAGLSLALKVIEAWGFKYRKPVFIWVKVNKQNIPVLGPGYYTRNSIEICLLGKRGRVQRQTTDVRQVIFAPRRGHSRKPDEQYERIEQITTGPYLELFARQHRPGWDNWGLEVNKFDEHL